MTKRSSIILILILAMLSSFVLAQEFKITTINVWGKPTNKKRDLDSRVKRICEVLSNSEHPHHQKWDIIIIQEAWLKSVRKEIFKCSSKLFPYQMGKSERSWKSGLMTISRFPIIQKKVFKFNKLFTLKQRLLELDFSEKFVSKSIYMSLIDIDGQGSRKVWVLNTHLSANFLPNGNSHSFFRRKQLQALVKVAKSLEKTGLPIVFGGDLNFSINGNYPEVENFNLLKKHSGFNNSQLSAQTENDSIETYSKSMGNVYALGDDGQLDQLWHSQNLEEVQSGLSFHQRVNIKGRMKNYSDHYGWESTYIFK